MKTWPLLIGIIIIFGILCSPVLAINKNDIISQYLTITPNTPTRTPQIPSWFVPSPSVLPYYPSVKPTIIPTTVPTQVPTGTGTGTIVVGAHPSGAMVYLDGEYRGVTPVDHGGVALPLLLELTGVSAGSHQIRVTKEGYQDYIASLTVTEGETTFVDATLAPISRPSTGTGTISVTSTPASARIYLDGADTGITPLTIPDVPTGLHKVKVTKTGYYDYSKWVFVQSDRTTSVAVILKSRQDQAPLPPLSQPLHPG